MPITRDTTPTPPPARRTASTTKAATTKLSERKQQETQARIDGMNAVGSAIHMTLLAARLPADAGAVNRHVPGITKAIAEYAENNPGAGEKLDKLTDVTPLAGIAMAVVPLFAQIAVNHNLFGFKAQMFSAVGVVTPDTLIAESETFLMETQRKAMQEMMLEQRAHAQAVEDFQQMQADMATESANAGV